jgi:hypothetical protein
MLHSGPGLPEGLLGGVERGSLVRALQRNGAGQPVQVVFGRAGAKGRVVDRLGADVVLRRETERAADAGVDPVEQQLHPGVEQTFDLRITQPVAGHHAGPFGDERCEIEDCDVTFNVGAHGSSSNRMRRPCRD